MPLWPTDDVRAAMVDERIVLLDLTGGEYLTLDRVATAMWEALTDSMTPEEQVAALAARFAAPASVLAEDLRGFERECRGRGWLSPKPPRAPVPAAVPRRMGAASAPSAWLALAFTTRSLSRNGFPATYRRWQELPKPADPAPAPRREEAVAAFARAEHAFVIKRAPKDCLPRSLALYRFLVSAGIAADHRIGVHRIPFAAHAWVECDGEVLLDSPEVIAKHTPIALL